MLPPVTQSLLCADSLDLSFLAQLSRLTDSAAGIPADEREPLQSGSDLELNPKCFQKTFLSDGDCHLSEQGSGAASKTTLASSTLIEAR